MEFLADEQKAFYATFAYLGPMLNVGHTISSGDVLQAYKSAYYRRLFKKNQQLGNSHTL